MTPPRRADAVRNRERVVAAAATLFAQRGIEAGVPEIAALAGVGKGTVYRSFPTKEHLIAAVVVERLGAFERMVRERLGDPDPWAALVDLFGAAAERHCADRSVTDAISAAVELPELAEARAAMWGAVGELMERAKRQGALRADARPADIRMLWGGASRLLAADGVDDAAEWRRYAELAVGALRA
jgi:AcrR family transcriptional regulator